MTVLMQAGGSDGWKVLYFSVVPNSKYQVVLLIPTHSYNQTNPKHSLFKWRSKYRW